MWGAISIDLPTAGSMDLLALAIAAIAAMLLFRLKRGVLTTLGICAAVGLAAGIVQLLTT